MQERSCQLDEIFALVFADGHAERQFVEDIAVNRGFDLRAFESVDDAVEWVCEDRLPGSAPHGPVGDIGV